ncbi:MAG: beta-galactosidase [Verrucomicrobia bacterium]|nr:beta-galactosidase [Verrucomicrobiota bacterium]
MLSQNLQPCLGVCYYPEQWSPEKWASDFDLMRDIGIRIARIGEFAWSRLEPARNRFHFDWLYKVLDLAHERKISVVLGTPTATPPKWLIDEMPEMLMVDKTGIVRKFGSRRHYCFSHPGYRRECERIVTELARAFGQHPAVAVWQTDNEFGCHNTTASYSVAARDAFRNWLQAKYQSIERLNETWGNVFWSLEYRDFLEIELPNLTVTNANPAHWLDFRRFSSDQIKSFNQLQIDILRKFSPGRLVLHNFMGRMLDFDHFSVAEDLDAASWDSYPLGFLSESNLPESHKERYMNSGDPDFVAFHHDLYRACGRGRWWIMEQQPGPVNWASYNPSPHPGMVRFWTHEAFAHGAEVVSYFRWRQAPFAQEQMHAGLHLPNGDADIAASEAQQVVEDLAQLSTEPTLSADVALIFDYEAAWTLEIQPQGDDFKYLSIVLDFYRALRRLGFNIDVVSQKSDLGLFKLIVIPPLPIVSDELIQSLQKFDGRVLIAPRTGSKTKDFKIPAELPPGPLQALIPIQVVRVESFPSSYAMPVNWNSVAYESRLWLEHIRTDLTSSLHLTNGHGIVYQHEKVTYLATIPDEPLLRAIIEEIAANCDLEFEALPEGVRKRGRGDLQYFFNYNPEPVSIHQPAKTKFVLGSAQMPVSGVAIVQRESQDRDEKKRS